MQLPVTNVFKFLAKEKTFLELEVSFQRDKNFERVFSSGQNESG